MSVGHGASHWITGTFFLLLPKIREEFGFSYAEISLIGTIYYIGSLSSNVIGGPAVAAAKSHLPGDFEYTVVKYNQRTGAVSFIAAAGNIRSYHRAPHGQE